MEGHMVEWNPTVKTLIARYPLKPEFQNPRQYMQGGFVVAALDNTLGPLSYLSGAPSVTMQLNTTYIRPAAPHYDYIEIHAVINEMTSSKVYSSAEARSPEGKLLSSVQAISHIVK
jgi:acyl-coenzyme A thioesterase PaaI-like protein